MAIMDSISKIFKEKGKALVGSAKSFSGIAKEFDKERELKIYENIYKANPLVHSAINYTADLAVGTGYNLISEDENAKKEVDEFFTENNIQLLMHRVVRHMLVYGNAYVEIVRMGEDIVEFKLIDPKTIKVKVSKTGDIEGYEQKLDSIRKPISFKPEEIAHFKWNVLGDEIEGTSAIASVHQAVAIKGQIESDLRLISHRYAAPQVHYKGGIPEDPWNEDDVTNFEGKLNDIHPEMDLITDHRVEANVISPLSKGIGVEEFLKHMENQVVSGLQVPEVALGRGHNITEATAKVQVGIFDRRVKSIQRVLIRQTERLFIDEITTPNTVKVEFGEFDKEDEDVKVNRLLRLKTSGIVTPQYVAQQLGIDKKFIPKEDPQGNGDKALKGLDDTKKDVSPPKRPLK